MLPLQASRITGTYASLLLPLTSAGSIDWSLLEIQLDSLISSGVDGLYSHGTAGEFYSLAMWEFLKVNEMLAQKCAAAALPFQIGASFPTPQHCLERVRLAAQLAPGAIQIVLPDWYPVSDSEAVAFLDKIAEAAAPIPLVLYNPPHAKRVLQPEDFIELCPRIPALIGIKVGGGDRSWYLRMRALRERLSIFVPGHTLATGYAQGAAGSYSNVACLQPRGAKRWNALMQSDPEAAQRLEREIQAFLTAHVLPLRDRYGYSNMALDKLLAAAGGWAPLSTRLRWPYAGVDESEAARLGAIARRDLPYLFTSDPVPERDASTLDRV